MEEATALLTEFESSDMETETDLEFGLAQPAENDETPTTLESASKSKCRFSLGPSWIGDYVYLSCLLWCQLLSIFVHWNICIDKVHVPVIREVRTSF